MHPARLLRRLPSALLLLATLVLPGSAVAHGVAHHEEHAHAGEHGHASAHREAGPAISSPDHGHDHQHIGVDSAVRGRADVPIAAVPQTGPVLPPANETVAAATAPVPRTLLPRGDPGADPPPRLRAPPTC